MKIRTDFVTNSSSYSTAEVVIDNPVLLEILQKYEKMGTFDIRRRDFSINNYENLEIDPRSSHEEISITPALAVGLMDDSYSWGNVPSSLSDVVENILCSLNEGGSIKDNDLFAQMKSEMENKSDEITAAYKQVIWNRSYTNNEENPEDYNGYITEKKNFVFDPVKGEDYHFTKIAGIGEDEEIEEGFVFAEKHVVNGEIVVDFVFESEDEGEDDEEYEEEDDDE